MDGLVRLVGHKRMRINYEINDTLYRFTFLLTYLLTTAMNDGHAPPLSNQAIPVKWSTPGTNVFLLICAGGDLISICYHSHRTVRGISSSVTSLWSTARYTTYISTFQYDLDHRQSWLRASVNGDLVPRTSRKIGDKAFSVAASRASSSNRLPTGLKLYRRT